MLAGADAPDVSEPEMKLLIRHMRAQDLASVVAIEAASFSSPWTEEMLRDELARVEIERDALRSFAQAVMECWPMGDLDGGELHDAAVAHGLLIPETRHEPCAEGCNCAENADAQEWRLGVVCYRKTPLLKGPNAGVTGSGDGR